MAWRPSDLRPQDCAKRRSRDGCWDAALGVLSSDSVRGHDSGYRAVACPSTPPRLVCVSLPQGAQDGLCALQRTARGRREWAASTHSTVTRAALKDGRQKRAGLHWWDSTVSWVLSDPSRPQPRGDPTMRGHGLFGAAFNRPGSGACGAWPRSPTSDVGFIYSGLTAARIAALFCPLVVRALEPNHAHPEPPPEDHPRRSRT
jgi:hypothetical protein